MKQRSRFQIYTEEFLIEETRRKPDASALTKQLTGRLRETYWHVNPIDYSFYTNNEINILTEESEELTNSGFDNSSYDLIVSEGDILGSATSFEGRYYSANPQTVSRYQIIKKLGNGMFGQVFKALDLTKNREVAIKILKSKSGYFRQGMLEAIILSILNDVYDQDGSKHSVRMYDHFLYCNHLCIVFELLGSNLYEIIKENEYQGFTICSVRKSMKQLLECLDMLYDAHIVHCDIKPENLILDATGNGIKVLDFGSACFDNYTLYTYVQSRHYRAPEIILGIPYNNSIDMWSAGCIAAELIIGIPLFPGSSEFNQLFKITDMLGDIPIELLEQGNKTSTYFNRMGKGDNIRYIMKRPFEYEIENGVRLEPNKKYFRFKTLRELIMRIQLDLGEEDGKESITNMSEIRLSLLHFIEGMLEYDPMKRWTPSQALQHPFITGKPFTSNWQPPSFCSQPRQPFKRQTISMTSHDFVRKCFGNREKLTSLTSAEYYDICTTALQMGEVVNITSSNPFQLGPMTPEPFRNRFEEMKNPSTHLHMLPVPQRITRRKSSLRRGDAPNRSQLKSNSRLNGLSPMKIIETVNGNDEFLGNLPQQPQRKRFQSYNAGIKRAPVADYKLINKLDFDPKDIGSVKLENTYHDPRLRENTIVQEPSNVNIPIVPIPIRSETSEEQFEFAPLFIFGK